MIRRVGLVAAAAGCLALAADQARTWWAEQAYDAGLRARDPRTGEPLTDAVSRDAPGRLEAYDEAVARDPSQPLYALRAGQVACQRRAPARAAAAAELTASARQRLERAILLQPLEGRAYAELAALRYRAREPAEALVHARAALVLGPRRPAAIDATASVAAAVWRTTSDPDALVAAVDAARLGFELADGRDPELPPLGRIPGRDPTARLLLAVGGPGRDDLLFALAGRPELLATAAQILRRDRPDDAAALSAAADTRP